MYLHVVKKKLGTSILQYTGTLASALAIWNVPTVSMLEAMMGTPEKVSLELRKIISRVRSTLTEGTNVIKDDGHPGEGEIEVPEDDFSR